MKNGICAVFDLDDTLYLEREYVCSGFNAVGRWAAKWIEIPDFGERCWQKFEAGLQKQVFDEVLCDCGLQPVPSLITALVETYRTHMPSIGLAPDAAEALKEISRTSLVAVVSDGPASSQSRKVEALELQRIATPIVLTDLLGIEFRKPHPKAFEYVEQRRLADVYVYVADNPLKDFTAPKKFGWASVRVRRPGGLHWAVENTVAAPDLELTDCSALPEALAQL